MTQGYVALQLRFDFESLRYKKWFCLSVLKYLGVFVYTNTYHRKTKENRQTE